MSNKLSSYSFRSLLALFDEQIYSSFFKSKKELLYNILYFMGEHL